MDKIVWLNEERCFAVLVSKHAHYAVVRLLDQDLNSYEMEVLNDDYDDREGDDLDG